MIASPNVKPFVSFARTQCFRTRAAPGSSLRKSACHHSTRSNWLTREGGTIRFIGCGSSMLIGGQPSKSRSCEIMASSGIDERTRAGPTGPEARFAQRTASSSSSPTSCGVQMPSRCKANSEKCSDGEADVYLISAIASRTRALVRGIVKHFYYDKWFYVRTLSVFIKQQRMRRLGGGSRCC
ncbi:hypothetical protein AGR7B_Cc10167 [Agrobacterium deltaense RV3]|nr:hypothetical protein AGR7B_Cc10167 [Agrobacterium deltaense RV3]